MESKILITGAAGGVGSTAHTAIAILLEQGHRVRAMVHKLDARAETLRDMGAEIVVADMLDIITVRAAMQGCSVVYFTMSISPNYLEVATNVAVAAKSLGVEAFVNLSQMTVSQMSETETTSSPQQKQEWLAEQTGASPGAQGSHDRTIRSVRIAVVGEIERVIPITANDGDG